MAYNPFNIFRRNQKAIFAVVTVIIMFVFVLSSGLGGSDFFEWFPRWLGAKSKKGDVVCKLDGTKIYQSDLSGGFGSLQFKRVIASRFMIGAANSALQAIDQFQKQQMDAISDTETRRILMQGASASAYLRSPEGRQLQYFRAIPQLATQLKQFEAAIAACDALASSSTAKPIEKEIVRARQYADLIMDESMNARGGTYFFRAPNQTQSDLIDFMLWQKKADQLGISFTTDDIKQLIQKEFYGFFHSDVPVLKELRSSPGFNIDDCIKAIGEEFRVRTAQVAVLGPSMIYLRGDKTFGGSTIFSPPFEVFEYYREQCSPTDYVAFPIPVAGLVNSVTQEPQEKELERLFDQYKDDEYNPGKETPGFKTPRQVKLEWISASGTEPYYVKMAEESLKAGELQAKVGSELIIPFAGIGPGWIVSATAPLIPKDTLLELDSVRKEYTSQSNEHYASLERDWHFPSIVTELSPTSTVRPSTLVAALGGFVGGTLTLSGPVTGINTFETAVRASELRDRILTGAPAVLGAVPGPGMFATMMGGQASMQSLLPKPLPIDVVKPQLMKHLLEQTAKQLVINDMTTFKTKVAELSENGNAKDKSPVLKYIAEFIAARNLPHGASEKLRTEWTLEDDPGLAPIREVLAKNVHGNAVVQFGKKFFWADDARPGQKTPISGTYKAEFYPSEPNKFESPSATPEARFIVWRTEETRAVPAKSFQAAKDQVLAAWKRIKARDLARNRAEALANQMQSMAGDVPELIDQNINELANTVRVSIADPKIRDRVKVFPINGVCPLIVDFQGPHPFELRPSRDIPYPTRAMIDTLLAQRTKPPKTSFVLVDEPKDTYYVVTLKVRQVKSEQEFQQNVYTEFPLGMAGILGQSREAVMGSYIGDARKKTMESVLGLLKQEFKLVLTDEQKKKLEEKEKSPEKVDDFQP